MYVRPKRVPMGQLRSPLPGSSFIATHSVSGSINLTVTFSCYKNPVDCQTFEEEKSMEFRRVGPSWWRGLCWLADRRCHESLRAARDWGGWEASAQGSPPCQGLRARKPTTGKPIQALFWKKHFALMMLCYDPQFLLWHFSKDFCRLIAT